MACLIGDMRYYAPDDVCAVDEDGIPTNTDQPIGGLHDDEWDGLSSYYKCACGYAFLSWSEGLAHLGLDRDV